MEDCALTQLLALSLLHPPITILRRFYKVLVSSFSVIMFRYTNGSTGKFSMPLLGHHADQATSLFDPLSTIRTVVAVYDVDKLEEYS
jgi:hypothetical protein